MSLDRNQAAIREACDAGLLAGAVTLVWRHGRVLQVNEIGYRDVDAGLPMRRDTVFRIASMTKPITVAAAMSLVDEGKLRLDDPINRWAPEFAEPTVLLDPTGPLERTCPAQRPITIDDLRTHRSGLAYGFSVTGPIAREYRRLPFGQGPDAFLAAIAKLPLVHQPGDRLPSSHATDVLGVLLARIENKPLPRVLDERILGPLAMTDTGFFVSPQGRSRAATMYRLENGTTLRGDAMGPVPIMMPAFPNAGGGLLSTVDDYLSFARMLLADGVFDGVRSRWAGDVQLAGRLGLLVAGRPGRGADPAVSGAEPANYVRGIGRRGRRQYLDRETAHRTTEVRPPDLSRIGSVGGSEVGLAAERFWVFWR